MGTISTDPIGFSAGDANLYRYVGNHGTYASDPSGLDELIFSGSVAHWSIDGSIPLEIGLGSGGLFSFSRITFSETYGGGSASASAVRQALGNSKLLDLPAAERSVAMQNVIESLRQNDPRNNKLAAIAGMAGELAREIAEARESNSSRLSMSPLAFQDRIKHAASDQFLGAAQGAADQVHANLTEENPGNGVFALSTIVNGQAGQVADFTSPATKPEAVRRLGAGVADIFVPGSGSDIFGDHTSMLWSEAAHEWLASMNPRAANNGQLAAPLADMPGPALNGR